MSMRRHPLSCKPNSSFTAKFFGLLTFVCSLRWSAVAVAIEDLMDDLRPALRSAGGRQCIVLRCDRGAFRNQNEGMTKTLQRGTDGILGRQDRRSSSAQKKCLRLSRFRGRSSRGRCVVLSLGVRGNVHVKVFYGRSSHHRVEAVFKAFGRALRVACSKDRQLARMLPSTKGLL